MALIRDFKKGDPRDRYSIHEEIEAVYRVFERDSRKIIQIDTHGRKEREFPEKVSQSIQLDRTGAEILVAVLRREYGL